MGVRFSDGGDSRDGNAWRFSLLFPKGHSSDQPLRYTLGRDRRLRKGREFAAVWRGGKGWSNDLLVLRIAANATGTHRFGFSVSRKLGKAVVRNHVKRRLRELLRQRVIPESWDIVVVARPPAAQASYRQLEQAVDELLSKAGLLATSDHKPLPPRKDKE